MRQLLIVGELALALVLLSAGGLMLKSVARLQATELGFTPDHLISARLVMAPEQYDNARGTRLLVALIDRLSANPLVEAVGYNYCAPLSGRCNGTTAKFPGRPQAPNTAGTLRPGALGIAHLLQHARHPPGRRTGLHRR